MIRRFFRGPKEGEIVGEERGVKTIREELRFLRGPLGTLKDRKVTESGGTN